MSTRRIPDLIPHPIDTLEQAERFRHRDIATLDPIRAWAECELLERRLAMLTYRRDRPRTWFSSTGEPTTETAWIQERVARLRAFLRRRAA
jgi:hypothetical protein